MGNLLGNKIARLHPRLRDTKLRLRETDDWQTAGQAIIGDPSSLICATVNTDNNGDPVMFIGSIHAKGIYGDVERNITSQYADLGGYTFYANRPTSGAKGEGRWRMVDGYPAGIYEYSWINPAEDKSLKARAFTWKDALLMIADTDNINDLKFGIEILNTSLDNSNCTGEYKTIPDSGDPAQGYIIVQENVSEWWIAGMSKPMNEYTLDDGPVNVQEPLDEDQTAVTASRAIMAMGADGLGGTKKGRVVWAFSIATQDNFAWGRAYNALQNYEQYEREAEAWWRSFYAGVGENWKVDDELRMKGYLALQQIAAQSYKGWMSAGVPSWYTSFLRDNGWIIKALAHHRPALAKDLLEMYVGHIVTNMNAVTLGGVVITGANSDNAAAFLIGLAEYCNVTGDYKLHHGMPIIANNLLSYAQTNFVARDRHITVLDNHDYWDNYVDEINHELVKYESYIDVTWIAALERMAPVYAAWGDKERERFCIETAAALRAGLADYRRDDGGLEYAIKTDGELYDTVLALPGTLMAAWLLDDTGCKEAVRTQAWGLGLRDSTIHYALGHSNGPDAANKASVRGPHIPIVALLAAEHFGDESLVNLIRDSFNLGGFPEYVTMGVDYYPVLAWASHAPSFPWSHAAVLELIGGLSE
ncbi:MAG: hypothetical protein ACOX8W_02935 [bacterium]